MKFTERYFHTGDVALNLAEWPSPSLDAPAMVLVHGYGSNWHTWGRVTDKFAQDFHLYAVDLRGMGRSGRFGNLSHRQTWADDVHRAREIGSGRQVCAVNSFSLGRRPG